MKSAGRAAVSQVRRARHGLGLILLVVVLNVSIAAPRSSEGTQSAANHQSLVTQTASFGPVVPGKLGTPATVVMPFCLPISKATAALGYHVTAVSTFVFTPAMPAAGGKSVTAADLLLGITNVSSTLGRSSIAAIATEFDYDPSAIRGASSGGRFQVAATERATLADLLPGREILRAGRSSDPGSIPAAGGTVTFNLGIAVPTQYFTPGSFSGTIRLVVQ